MIIIDFETRSEVDIKCGIKRYANHPSTKILMMAWQSFPGEDIHQWFPGDPLPSWVADESEQIYAFNASFEYEIWNACIGKMPYSRFEDVQALCARYSLPRSLALAGRELNLPDEWLKSSNGKTLIKLFSCPPFAGKIGSTAWKQFCEYNKQDVRCTAEILRRLPAIKLSALERAIFDLNWRINLNGLPIAADEANKIFQRIQAFIDEHNGLLPELTDGKVEKITQIQRLLAWIQSKGIFAPNLQAETVEELLATLPDSMPDVIQVLELRAATGLSSIGKYKRIKDMAHEGRIFYNSNYYGAHTGRITGSGFQLLNLPRAKVSDPEEAIENFDTLPNPVLAGRALIRSMIKAPDGCRLLCADYSSIEFILLVWLAGDVIAVRDFAKNIDQYRVLASTIFNAPYDEISKEQRQIGKVGVLGCGYGLGMQGCIRYAKQYGLELDEEMASAIVGGYRGKFNAVPRLWYALSDAAMAAVRNKGESFCTYRTTFQCMANKGREYLRMLLPSGRAMYYHFPQIEECKYSELVCVRGLNQISRKMERREMTPGKWAENVIQAIGRDILYHGKFAIEKAGYKIIGSIYDEVIAEVPNDFGSLDEFIKLMTSPPEWCKDLPLRADGWEGKRYKKE